MNKQGIEEILKEKGFLITTAKGVSMLPMIRPEQDNIVLKVPDTDLKKLDVVLYKRKNGTYILHRILDMQADGYVLCGDNQTQKEYGVQKEQILGVLEGVYRDKKYVDVNSRSCRIYTLLWCSSILIRKFVLFGIRVIRKIRRIVKTQLGIHAMY